MDQPVPASYRAVLAVPGFGRMMGASMIGRAAGAMLNVVIVLFVLQRFHSPALAGITVFMFIGPGMLLSPMAGALLDRHGRVRLIMLDYLVASVALLALAGLSAAGWLQAWLLVVLTLLGGLTGLLSAAGIRSVVPLVLPEHLWGRGNALDSSGYTLTVLVGPALGGVIVGAFGPEPALAAVAALFAIAAISLLGVTEPGAAAASNVTSLWRNALEGVTYVARHPVLRGIAGSLTALNVGAGMLVVAMPVLALGEMHGNSSVVGALWAAQGLGGATAGFVFGRLETRHHEWRIIVTALLATAAATGVMAVAPNLWWLGIGSLLTGLVVGPLDVTLFSLRQRVTEARWLGRAIAVSMSVNFAGFPVGSAISGPFVAIGPRFTMLLAAAMALVSAGVAAAWLRPSLERRLSA